MIKVLFSHSYYYKLDPKQWKNKNPFPPLGTIYAASYLRENGCQVDLFDTNLLDHPYEIEQNIIAKKPRFLVLYDDGFNYLTKMCLTNMREAAFAMITIGKKHECTVIVCSSDATDHCKKYLDKGADYIIKGEGEIVLKELIFSLNETISVEKIEGIAYKHRGKIIHSANRRVLNNLDELPLPAWDLIDIEAYKKIWKESGKEFTLNIATTRGCPYKCNWCAKPIYGNRYNSHSPEYIVKHLRFLSENYNVNRFWMCDDIFGLKPNWPQQFNQELKKNNLKISYYIQSRADLLLKEDTINALAESGIEEVWIGAESASQKILDAMDKGIKVEQIYEATKLLKEKNIKVAFFIQFGYLGETKKDIAKTIAMIKELIPDHIGISVSYPLPGTKFYDIVKADLKLKTNWTDSDDLSMLFKGTFNSKYYKKLHRYVHKEYRKSQGFYNLKQFLKHPFSLNYQKLRSIILNGYYIPSAFINKLQLNNMNNKNG